MVLVNFLANWIPLNGQTTGEISNRLEVLFTPAGYVFSIWGVIYLLLGTWIVRQWFNKDGEYLLQRRIGPMFIVSCILNAIWIVLWHYEYFTLTVLVMIGLLTTLIIIYRQVRRLSRSRLEKASFSIYLGWISVATIANISYWLVYIGWGQWGLSAVTWTLIMLVVASVLALYIMWRYCDGLYVLVFIWAFVGIGVQNYQAYQTVAIAAYLLAATLFVVSLWLLFFKNDRMYQ
ncbi:hypothetical protein BHF68_04405 [Desulfuribacillus alkaliarsenatis]|uniref:Tryptophan-rich sensory protein n=2 Tax=Desulfuribacillus alkaliarsenatis TaxID=766136 RepID=A0A1E5G3E4_9FIRM|nr:hypothetical protein BHF68_04405 [Desulfuribacillus alkaliarsenatis]